jgi:hypothetical protein
MSGTLEIARFRVAPASEPGLLEAWPRMVAAMRRAHPALRSVDLVRFDDGTWADVAVWDDRDSAERACSIGPALAEVEAFFAHISEDVGLELARVVQRSS